ncbi:peptidoglycan editing factor PgeF [Psychrosphaera sp.]|nr:peptidoglycan editing factor PgeF [Psychrosphaera sp.]
MTWTSASFKGLNKNSSRQIHAGTTTRRGGVSIEPYAGLNLATHVGDELLVVLTNREIVKTDLNLPSPPFWLNQTHSTNVIELPHEYDDLNEVDASFTSKTETVCAVLTADCLPIVVTDKNLTFVATVHAGWRGLVNGILANTVQKILRSINTEVGDLSVWIGPAIGPQAFEVGQEVKAEFEQKFGDVEQQFTPCGEEKYLADLPQLARLACNRLGIINISYSDECTYSQSEKYYSYRKEGQTGRIATLAWLSNS